MGLLDFSSVGSPIVMAPTRNSEVVPVLATTNGSGDVIALSGYDLSEIPVTRSGGQYNFDIGIYSRLLGVEAASSLEGASQTYTKVGETILRITYPAAVTSGYISFNAYVDREIG